MLRYALSMGQDQSTPTKHTQPPASKRFGTVVCDHERCVVGNYKPVEGKGTAHMRLAKAAGMKNPQVAGSIKSRTDPERGIRRGDISLRSESVNRPNLGDCDAKGTALGDWASMKMALGEVESVKEYKMATRSSTKAKAEPRSTRSSTATSTVASTASSQRGARGSRTYVDNAANRKAGRVGKAY
eukprot:CAMPEP_0182525822 /NCGR_PEP_ID=MMETSP1323-20130603/2747_1 /TAXON_ID=236787 /ORGANISM="Florenciella parvula, Strain RCC1693" /LENGTH=184 /DNA_ID=CAMNT_0024734585 /DNA_START=83 /DNA_END=637 /DNA_ORIENTATION=+